MVIRTCVIGLCVAAAALAGDWQEEAQKDAERGFREQEREMKAVGQALLKAPHLEFKVPDSLNLQGDGVEGLRMQGMTGARPSQVLMLQKGTLYLRTWKDFDRLYLQWHLDPSRDFAMTLQKRKEDFAKQAAIPGLPKEIQEHVAFMKPLLDKAKSPADLEAIDSLMYYRQCLPGKLGLTPAQADKVRADGAKRLKGREEFSALLASRKPGQADSAKDERILRALSEMDPQAQARAAKDSGYDFLTAEQKHAMGLDALPGDGHGKARSTRASASASAGGSASAGDGDDAEMQAQIKKAEEEQKAAREKAPLNFGLKGRDASGSGQQQIQLQGGLLWIFYEALPDGSGFQLTYNLDKDKTWEVQKAQWKSEWEKGGTEYEGLLKQLEGAGSRVAYDLSHILKKAKDKLVPFPTETQTRVDALVKEADQVAGDLEKAYLAALDKPQDPVLQHALFSATRDTLRSQARVQALSRRSEYDPDGLRDDLPWLFSLDEIDRIEAGELVTSSSSTGGTGGSLMIQAHPKGKQQYISVRAEGMTLEQVAEALVGTTRRSFHNHNLKLVCDPAVLEKPLRGTVEGTSAEEIYQSLATRSGTSLLKDEKDPDSWTLKPAP